MRNQFLFVWWLTRTSGCLPKPDECQTIKCWFSRHTSSLFVPKSEINLVCWLRYLNAYHWYKWFLLRSRLIPEYWMLIFKEDRPSLFWKFMQYILHTTKYLALCQMMLNLMNICIRSQSCVYKIYNTHLFCFLYSVAISYFTLEGFGQSPSSWTY